MMQVIDMTRIPTDFWDRVARETAKLITQANSHLGGLGSAGAHGLRGLQGSAQQTLARQSMQNVPSGWDGGRG